MMIIIVEDNHDDQPIIKSSPDVGLLWECRPPCNVFIAQQLHQSLIMIIIAMIIAIIGIFIAIIGIIIAIIGIIIAITSADLVIMPSVTTPV